MNVPTTKFPQCSSDPRVASSGSRREAGRSGLRRASRSFLTGIGILASLLGSGLALAQVAPSLGSEAPFGVVSSTFTNTAAGTTINGNLCFTTGPFFPATVTGTTGACPAAAGTDQLAALAIINGQACTPLPAGNLDTVVIGANPPGTIPPGCYERAGAIDITVNGIVTLNGNGVYIFKSTAGALTTGANSSFLLTGGACADNVFWAPVGATTLGATSAFVGNILDAAGVALGLNSTLLGRALAFGGTVSTSASTITVPTACAAPPPPLLVPPTLSKDFNPAIINAGGTSTLTITFSNPESTGAILIGSFTDTLPSGVVVAPIPNVGTTCTDVGAPVAVAGGSTVTLPGGRSIPANGSCTLTVDVTAALGGTYLNTIPANTLFTSNGNNAAPALATLNVVSATVAPTLGKAFSPATINAGGISTLTVTLNNASAVVATLTAPLTDTLPSGVVIAPTPNANTTCGGAGAPVAIAGGTTVSLPAGRTIPANGSCTLTVDVTAATSGSYINTLQPGSLVTTNGNNPGSPSATLTVIAPAVLPFLGKAFSPASINAGGTSTLTVTLSNTNAAVATLTSALVDTLPSGVVVAPTPNVGTTCTGAGAPVAAAGGSTVTLPAGRSIPANGSCTLTVDVTAAIGGTYVNTLAAGALVTSNGNNPAPAVATLTVVSPVLLPAIGKTFTPSTINAGGVSTLTVTLRNPDPTVATLTSALIDTLPSGVLIAPTPNVSTTCTGTGAPVAVAGATTVTLPAGRSIPANGSCTLTVSVTAAAGGSYVNTIVAGALMTSNGNNPGPAIATLTVIPRIVTPGPGAGGPIPTLSEWAMILLAGLMAIAGFAALRGRKPL